MISITAKEYCTGCHACAASCPKNCIAMTADEEGFLYPHVNQTECIDCGKCEKVCPLLNHKTQNTDALQIGYAAYNTNEEIRLNSSSGGIFTLLAEYIIHSGGIVFGAAMSEDCKSVRHIAVETIKDLEKIRGSKYVQSTIGDTYKIAKQALDAGRLVLFTGTPCQISGLLSFLGKEYDNLFTQDLICHGVPSPSVWSRYAEVREKESGSLVRRVFFRHKKYGWKRFSVLFEFSNNTKYMKDLRTDTFMQGFLANIYLRPSCYKCVFKTVERQADITLADFWGIQKEFPELNDDKGISFVWIHSENGLNLFKQISGQIISQQVDVNYALSHNTAAIKCPSTPKNRNQFFRKLDTINLEKTIRRYAKKPLLKRVRSFFGRVKRKFIGR